MIGYLIAECLLLHRVETKSYRGCWELLMGFSPQRLRLLTGDMTIGLVCDRLYLVKYKRHLENRMVRYRPFFFFQNICNGWEEHCSA